MGLVKRGKVFYMDFKLPDGRRIYRSTGTANKSEARLIEARTKENMSYHLLASPAQKKANMTLSVAIEKLFEERWARLNRGGEQEVARLNVVLSILGDKPIANITAADIAEVAKTLRKQGRSEGTVAGYMANIKTLLNTAHKVWEVIDRVPHITVPKPKNGRLETLSENEENMLLDQLRADGQDEYADLYTVLIDTGMRYGEAETLTKQNIDLERKLIILNPEQTKDSEQRIIPMTKRVFAIFQKRTRFNVNRWTSVRLFKNTLEKVGVTKKLVVHSLRHTCASRMVQNGVNLEVVAKILGHSSIIVTQRYAHLADKQLRAAISALEK